VSPGLQAGKHGGQAHDRGGLAVDDVRREARDDSRIESLDPAGERDPAAYVCSESRAAQRE